ncbi:MAG: DUF1800 domain-containing protein [Roseibacillus sp.]|jgi:uncharacterized protein (DUF1800 family)|nr:DUF1800 domain-containing protein [Roseibacillus sp.]MDP7308467.1 DUF1800 domain-containing protein [Roseibacillus sp.]HJM62951.1 DUF1800 domain-containing protein [Roseibacillus sp.]
MLSPAPDQWTVREAAHLLNRAGFGGTPAQIKTFHAFGRRKAVESLLKPAEAMDKFPAPEWATAENDPRTRELREKFMELRRNSRDMTPEERDRKRRQLNQQMQRARRELGGQLQDWWMNRIMKSGAPLREKMTIFWHDHFPSSLQKVRQPKFVYRQNQLFRDHATGNFKKLTHKIAVDPAMMIYLDTATSKRGKPNENFAREVLELFTLGEGNYGEQDITAAARAFTGYFMNRENGRVIHNRRAWDSGDKTFMGETGRFNGNDILEIVFKQPQAARYIPTKLWEYFAYEDPSQETVEALAKLFSENRFEVEPVLRAIFLSSDFYSDRTIRTRIKSPVEFLAQMFRQLELEAMPGRYLQFTQLQLGQQLLMPPNVAGWDWGQAWINTNSLLTRYNVAGFVTKGSGDGMARNGPQRKRPGGKAPPRKRPGGDPRMAARLWKGPDYRKIAPAELREDSTRLVQALTLRLFQDDLEPRQRETFEKYAKSKEGEVFTDKEVAELVHLMMSTPYYQLT